MSVPKLRFKEFDGDWNLSSLANISSIITGNTPSTSNREYYDGEFLFVSPVDIQENRYIEKTKTTLTANGFSKCRHIPENSVLFVCIGSTIGKVAQNKVICATNQQINAVIPKKGYSSDFLYLQLERLAPNIKLNAGVQAVPLINKTEFGKTLLNTPTFIEQTKIASFLSSVDEKISQLTQKHQLLSQYKQGMMQKLFSQQIRFKADDGSEFEEWEETIFEKIGVFLKGKGISKADIVPDGKIPCIRYGELYTYYGEVISKIISSTNIEAKNLVLSKANDILIPASGETQIDIATASCVLQDNIALSGDLNIFRTKENGIFLSYLIRSKLKMQIAQLAQGNSVVHLYASQLKGVSFSLPCLEEQTKIANFLSAIDQKIEVVAQQIEQAKQWKKGLLQQMFV